MTEWPCRLHVVCTSPVYVVCTSSARRLHVVCTSSTRHRRDSQLELRQCLRRQHESEVEQLAGREVELQPARVPLRVEAAAERPRRVERHRRTRRLAPTTNQRRRDKLHGTQPGAVRRTGGTDGQHAGRSVVETCVEQ